MTAKSLFAASISSNHWKHDRQQLNSMPFSCWFTFLVVYSSNWADSSVGRAIARHAIGRRFEPCSATEFKLRQKKIYKKISSVSLFGGVVASSLFFQILLAQRKYTWVAVSAFDKAGFWKVVCKTMRRNNMNFWGELNIRLFHKWIGWGFWIIWCSPKEL